MKRSKLIYSLGTALMVLVLLSCSDKNTGLLDEVGFEKPAYDPELAGDTIAVKETVRVFEQGSQGYHSYRIPSIVRTSDGSLLAIAEGRKHTSLDYGDIDIVYKISNDDGKTWGGLRVVINEGEGTWGNPTVVNDLERERVWLFFSGNDDSHSQEGGYFDGKDYPAVTEWGQRRVYSMYSDDNGLSWSERADHTEALLPPDFVWDAVGPGSGIQIVNGPAKGRLIIPAGERNIYSDDHGQTWKYQRIAANTFEGSIVELTSGMLLRNDRAVSSAWNRNRYRHVSKGSIEGGFSNFAPDFNLIDPRCQASILRISFSPNLIAFVNPARNDGQTMAYRCNMSIRLSEDDGRSWSNTRLITYPGLEQRDLCSMGYGGYTSMAKIDDQEIALLVEQVSDPSAGKAMDRRHSIDFHRMNLNWIRGSQAGK